MIDLPSVTLIALTNQKLQEHEEAIRKSTNQINFGAVKLIVDYQCTSINEWNRKIIYELHNYVQTSHCLLIHADGYVIHPEVWQDKWLEYDFIGAPWPLPKDDFSYRTESGRLVRVGNSVSLRSKRLLRAPTDLHLPWKSYHGYWNEDGFIACNNRDLLESYGFRYAPLEEACKFSKEHSIEENKDIEKTFCFHATD